MARTSPTPGPPPPHFRPAGTAPARSSGPLPGRALGTPTTPPPTTGGIGPGAATTIAVVTLLIGLVVGFFVGRAAERDDAVTAPPPVTSPSTATTTPPPGDTIPQNPPVDPDAPPSTDLDPTTIGTLEDPIPSGQSYVLGLYEVEVRSADRDAGAALLDFDPQNPPAPDGEQHVIVEVAVRYTEASGIGNPGAVPFFVSDGSTDWNDFEASCGSVPDSILFTGLIEQGEEAVGNACFTVPSDATDDELLLGTEGFDGPVYFTLP